MGRIFWLGPRSAVVATCVLVFIRFMYILALDVPFVGYEYYFFCLLRTLMRQLL